MFSRLTDDEIDIEDALDRLLEGADVAFDRDDRGYADADATVSMLRRHVDDLRAGIEE